MYIAKVTTYKRGRNVQVAKCPGGETSWGRNVLVAKRPGGETSRGRNVHKPLKAPSLMDQRRSRGATGQE